MKRARNFNTAAMKVYGHGRSRLFRSTLTPLESEIRCRIYLGLHRRRCDLAKLSRYSVAVVPVLRLKALAKELGEA